MLRLTLTILFVVCMANIQSITAKEKDSDEETSTESSAPSSKTSGKVAQCVCGELEKCMQDERTKMRPCIDECAKKISNADWNAEEGQKCFATHGQMPKPPACFQEFHKLTCASRPGVMLNKNETMHRRHHNRHSKLHDDSGTESTTAHPKSVHHGHGGPFGMRRGEFKRFMKSNFGDGAVEYKKCIKSCFHKNGGPGSCHRKLKCASKRLSPEELKSSRATCTWPKDAAKDRREQFCSCLQKSGLKELQCLSSDSKEAENTNEISETN